MEPNKDKFLNEVARIIFKRTSEKVHNLEKTVSEYLDAHLEKIVLVGLGIEPERWHNSEYGLLNTNGHAGIIARYVKRIARAKATERAQGVINDILEKRMKTIMKKSLGRDIKNLYAEAYRRELYSMIEAACKADEEKYKDNLEKVAEESRVIFSVIAKKELEAMIDAIEGSSK